MLGCWWPFTYAAAPATSHTTNSRVTAVGTAEQHLGSNVEDTAVWKKYVGDTQVNPHRAWRLHPHLLLADSWSLCCGSRANACRELHQRTRAGSPSELYKDETLLADVGIGIEPPVSCLLLGDMQAAEHTSHPASAPRRSQRIHIKRQNGPSACCRACAQQGGGSTPCALPQAGGARNRRGGPLDLLPLEAWIMIAERASCVPDLWALTATCRCGGSGAWPQHPAV